MSFIGATGLNTFDDEIENTSNYITRTSFDTSNYIVNTSNVISNVIFNSSNYTSNVNFNSSNYTSNVSLDSSNYTSNLNFNSSNYTSRIEGELSDRIGYPFSIIPPRLTSGLYVPLKAQELQLTETNGVVATHTGAIGIIEGQIEAIVGVGGFVGGIYTLITGSALGGAINLANTANNKANLANDKVDNLITTTTTEKGNTSNYIRNTSNILNTKINNNIPTVANVFPLFYNNHFQQISDGLNPNQISVKNINSSGRFDYDYLKLPPVIPTNIIVPIQEPTSSPSVSKITINSEYKYMAFTYTTGANNTPYTITFNENTECDILMVAGGGGGSQSHGGGGGGGAVIFMKSVNMNGNYNIFVGKGGGTTTTANGLDGIGLKGDATSIIQTSNQIIAEGGGGGGGKNTTNGDGQDGGSGGGGDAYIQSVGLKGNAVAYTPILHGITGIKYGNNGGNAKGNPGAGGAGGGAGAAALDTTHGSHLDNALQKSFGGRGISQATIGGVIYDFKDMFNLSTNNIIGQYHTGGTNNGSSANLGVYFGGGGGNGCWEEPGGAGGLGGGANGGLSNDTPAPSGSANTGGGGGGGSGGTSLGGNGGSGVVIIRYKTTKIVVSQVQENGFLNYTNANGWALSQVSAGTTVSPLINITEVVGSTRIVGNVGIGNTSPNFPLTVGNNAIGGSDGKISIGKNNGGGGSRFFTLKYNDNFDMCFSDSDNKDVLRVSWAAPANSLVVRSDGNVGIGVDSPGQKLSVSGNINATGNITSSSMNANTITSGGDLGFIAGYCQSLQSSSFIGTNGNLSCVTLYIGGNVWHYGAGREALYFGTDGRNYYKSSGSPGTPHTWRRGDDNTIMFVNNDGFLFAAGFLNSSDERIKKDIVDIDDTEALDKILLIQPKKYKYIDTEKGEHEVIGFIAQQIKSVLPHAVDLNKGTLPNGDEIEDFHYIRKDVIFALNVAATQELHRMIINQQTVIDDLISRIEVLES